VLIIGYGNTLRGDDAVGQLAAQLLADTECEHAQIIACHQLVPELAELLAAVDLVVFVDAAVGASPGEIRVSKLTASVASASLGHHMAPSFLLSVCDGLYEHTPDAFLVTVNVASLELGEGLSDIAACALPGLLATVRNLVLKYR
jgi:hydrogenase maturation protease